MSSFLATKFPLTLKSIKKQFGDNQVLRGVDLELAPGSITGLLGRNASGKTTMIRTAVGLLKPNEGDATLFGETAWEAPAAIRSRLGYVAQAFNEMGWLKVQTALDVIGSFYENWDRVLVNELREQWGVPAESKIGVLSHGQKQKVSILLAIGHRPELLVLDEPVASLDPAARHEFLRTLLMLNQEFNQTILFSSHITTDIERVAADVAILNQGIISYHGALDELKEQVRCLFLRADTADVDSRVDGYISSRVDGNRLQVWVRDWSDEKEERLGEELGVAVHAENVGLEELFMGMTSCEE